MFKQHLYTHSFFMSAVQTSFGPLTTLYTPVCPRGFFQLTVNGHALDHEVLIGVSGYDALVIARQLDGGSDQIQGPIPSQHIVSRRGVIEPDAGPQRPDGPRRLPRDPLVCRAGAVVEVPRDHQALSGVWPHTVHAVQDGTLGTVKHGARHPLFHDSHAAVSGGCNADKWNGLVTTRMNTPRSTTQTTIPTPPHLNTPSSTNPFRR